ncbi:putative O-methyltransferase [Nemania abortiva]|nr:putative O-methyltransferase [Nemania abortiva]
MSASPSRIAELASIVASSTQQIDDYLTKNSLPYPSFEPNAPADLKLPPDVEELRIAALEATQELNDLLMGPREQLFNHHHNQLVYLKFISHFDIAKKVPVDGEITYEDLAAKTGVDEAALTRILRMAIANRVFRELNPGLVSHSNASKQIADDKNMADWVSSNVNEMWPSAERLVDALEKWPSAQEPNQTGFALANDTTDSFYTELSKNPERARRFGGAMSFFTTGDGYSLRHLTDGFDWGAIGAGTVVDVGGSEGDAAFAIAEKYPNIKLTVQEVPEVVANAVSSNKRPELKVEFMAHDFFKEQPVKNADVYLYRWILHNWPDKYCVQILNALIPALKPGARVLIMDFVMPAPSALPNSINKKLRAMDVTMMEIANAKERSSDEWKHVLDQADSRFQLKGTVRPPGSNLSILEVQWQA